MQSESLSSLRAYVPILKAKYDQLKELVIDYSGSGDDGYVEPISGIDDIDQDALERILYDVLPGGWELEDGSSGRITINLVSGKIEWTHDDYYMETNSETVELD